MKTPISLSAYITRTWYLIVVHYRKVDRKVGSTEMEVLSDNQGIFHTSGILGLTSPEQIESLLDSSRIPLISSYGDSLFFKNTRTGEYLGKFVPVEEDVVIEIITNYDRAGITEVPPEPFQEVEVEEPKQNKYEIFFLGKRKSKKTRNILEHLRR